MKLPDRIPKSAIIHDEQNPYDRAKVLCDTYIREGSERQVNISYGVRTDIIMKFDKEDLNKPPTPAQYVLRFDEAADEIRRLLNDSFRRFSLTPV